MKLIPGHLLLQEARKNNYAVGAFSVHTAETVTGILEAAGEERSPVILMVGQRAIRNAGFQTLMKHILHFGESVDIPVAVHLDHGKSYEQTIQALTHRLTSVMYDGSHLPLAENIEITRHVVKAAHAVGVSVEAELGKIGGVEDDISVKEEDAFFTDPKEALEFFEKTGVDSLAVAIGSAHGLYKKEPKLDMNRLSEIYRLLQIPIVLHGGSGIPDSQIREAIARGIAKINVDTELRAAYTEGLRASLAAKAEDFDPYTYQKDAMLQMKEIVRDKIRLFGSENRA